MSDNDEQGKRDNKGKLRWRNVPMFLFEPVIEVGQFGEGKYDTFNFLKCFPVNDTMDSLKRHLTAFENPFESDMDKESLKNHMAHVAWNALLILHTLKVHPEMDDRYKIGEKKEAVKQSVSPKDEKIMMEYHVHPTYEVTGGGSSTIVVLRSGTFLKTTNDVIPLAKAIELGLIKEKNGTKD